MAKQRASRTSASELLHACVLVRFAGLVTFVPLRVRDSYAASSTDSPPDRCSRACMHSIGSREPQAGIRRTSRLQSKHLALIGVPTDDESALTIRDPAQQP